MLQAGPCGALRVVLATACLSLAARPAVAQPTEPPPPAAPTELPPPVAGPRPPLLPAPAAPAETRDAAVAALWDEVRALRAELEAQARAQQARDAAAAATAASPPAPAAATARPRPLGYEEMWPWVLPPEGLSVSGYVQAQYETHQDSQDQLSANGTLLNKDRFSIRRARVGLTGEWEYAVLALQLDANTTNGPQVDLRKAEASLQYRPDRTRPPLIMATMGLFDIPFGFENVEASHTRYFMEQTTASQAFFPGQAGPRGAPGRGVPLPSLDAGGAERRAARRGLSVHRAGPDLGEGHRRQVRLRHRARVEGAGGGRVSGLSGSGFHPGNLASGNSLQWNDTSGTGAITQASQLTGVAAQSATASQTFHHWAVGADLRTSIRWWPGVGRLFGRGGAGAEPRPKISTWPTRC